MSRPDREKVALITGIQGQDGRYLCRHLLRLGLRVTGASRTLDGYLNENHKPVPVRSIDYENTKETLNLLREVKPDYIFHLAAIASSQEKHVSQGEHHKINVTWTKIVLESMSEPWLAETKFVQALSSEIFAKSETGVFTEDSESNPNSFYGESKAKARTVLGVARDAGIAASSAILFSHESPLRPKHFLSRKVSLAAARTFTGMNGRLEVNNLSANRDWGHAKDYTEALTRLAFSEPNEYIIASGYLKSVRDFCEIAFQHVGRDYRSFVTEVEKRNNVCQEQGLVGDSSRIRTELGWQPSADFKSLVTEMVDFDVSLLSSLRGQF